MYAAAVASNGLCLNDSHLWNHF